MTSDKDLEKIAAVFAEDKHCFVPHGCNGRNCRECLVNYFHEILNSDSEVQQDG